MDNGMENTCSQNYIIIIKSWKVFVTDFPASNMRE